jgi:hypothetical protein
MVLRNHWLGTSTSGTRPSNQAITGPTLVVPAGGRLVRFLLFVLVDGFSTSTLGVGTLSSTQWYAQVTVDSNYAIDLVHINQIARHDQLGQTP